MAIEVDPRIRALAKKVIAEGKNKRAIAVLKALLRKGTISTDDLQGMGYNHPPRAVGDVRDAGIPIKTSTAKSTITGRRMAVYSFGDPAGIQGGRIGGRSALPKEFKSALLVKYSSIDCITGGALDERVLQIDHRVPYRIAGDKGLSNRNTADYMLLDASSQRAKSWSCEHCRNMIGVRDPGICRTCFWAFPEQYDHVAMEAIRRTDVVWQGHDVQVHDELKRDADRRGISIQERLLELARQRKSDS